MARPYIFLSYARGDADRAAGFRESLNRIGMDVVDGRDLRGPGLEAAIRDAVAFRACFSAAADATPVYARDEVDLAIAEVRSGRRTVDWLAPVKLTECDIPALPVLTLADLATPTSAGVPVTKVLVDTPPPELRNSVRVDNIHAKNLETYGKRGDGAQATRLETNDVQLKSVIVDDNGVIAGHDARQK
jgi:hypothetical protein